MWRCSKWITKCCVIRRLWLWFSVDNTLHEICNSYDINDLVTSATCFKSDRGTLLDLCIVSKPFRFRNILNLDCWFSDFYNFICITTKLNVQKRLPKIIRYRAFKHFNEQHLNIDLYALSYIISQCVIDYFCELLRNIVDMHAPIKTKKNIRHNNVPYMNSELRKWQYKRNMLRNIKNKKNPNKQNNDLYRKTWNKCASLRAQSRRKYFKERTDGGTKKSVFLAYHQTFLK